MAFHRPSSGRVIAASGECDEEVPVLSREAHHLRRARIEAVCYYLSSPDTANSAQAPVYRQAMDHLVEEIAKSQGPDGYIGIYFRVS